MTRMTKTRMSTLIWTAFLALALLAAAQEPAEPVALPPEDNAMVRIVHLSPNAAMTAVTLLGTDEAAASLTPEEWANLGYSATTEYVAVPAGEYQVMLGAGPPAADVADARAEAAADDPAEPADADAPAEPADAEARPDAHLLAPALEQTVTFSFGGHYTVAILGLVLPDDVEEPESGGGFFDWVRGLFGGDDPADDALGLRLEVIEDDPFAWIEADRARFRVVHAAPGTANLDVAVAGERGTLVRDLDFGDVSRNVDLDAADTNLEIRPTGSRALALDFSEVDLGLGMVHTIFITGTPIEVVPLDAVVLSDTPVALPDPAPIDPVVPGPADVLDEPAVPEVDDELYEPDEPDPGDSPDEPADDQDDQDEDEEGEAGA